MTIIAVLAMAALPCLAGEVAVLRNGFSIRHERREVIGATTRLYVNRDGSSFVDIPTADIEHFEAAVDVALAPVSATASASPIPVAATSRAGAAPVNLNQVVNEASERYRLDPDLVNSVIKAESGFNVHAVSRKGAQGLMQLMPGTASQLGVPNAFDAQANVEGGTKYLRELLERYNFDLVKALAAYNAGPLRVQQYGGVPPYYETRAYVARIVRDFNKKKTAAESSAAIAKSSAAKNQTKKSSGVASASAQKVHRGAVPSVSASPAGANVQAKASSVPE